MSNTPTPTSSVTRPEHMFEPDGFPTRILFVILGALAVALIVTVVVLMAYFESAAQAELAVKDDHRSPELLALRSAESDALQGYGFSSCPERAPPAAGAAPTPDVLCTPQQAKYYEPYEKALTRFLERKGEALQPGPLPPGATPLPTAQPGRDAGRVPRRVPSMQRGGADDGGAARPRPQGQPAGGAVVPPGARIEDRRRPPANVRPRVVPVQRRPADAGQPATPPTE